MSRPMQSPAPRPEALTIDARTTTWLLQRPRPAPDFFYRGVFALVPRAEQNVLGRVIADGEFQSGDERYAVVAILSTPYGGMHRLLSVAIQRQGDAWPTLCSELESGFRFLNQV